MQYIIHRRLKQNALCGPVNLPAGTEAELMSGGTIWCEKGPICYTGSETAHQYLARNDDGQGMERGLLTQAIQSKLAKNKGRENKSYQARWDKIWADARCRKYKREEYEDYWLWNDDFFQAEIADLQYIAGLIGVKGA